MLIGSLVKREAPPTADRVNEQVEPLHNLLSLWSARRAVVCQPLPHGGIGAVEPHGHVADGQTAELPTPVSALVEQATVVGQGLLRWRRHCGGLPAFEDQRPARG